MTPTIREIQTRTADFCGVRLEDILSERRSGDVARARQIAMYAARIATRQSLPAIGRAFNRDHTTVMYAVDKIDKRLWLDQEAGLYDAVKYACSREIADLKQADV